MVRNFSVIVAATQQNGIGIDNALPWGRLLPSDMAEFKRITTEIKTKGRQNAVIMGHKTWLSIPIKFRPLHGRLNIVLSRQQQQKEIKHDIVCKSLRDALDFIQTRDDIENIFVIGGSQLYRESFVSPFCESIYLTTVFKSYLKYDAFIPTIDRAKFDLEYSGDMQSENGILFQFQRFVKRHEEYQYLDLLTELIATGDLRANRTGTDTFGKFGKFMSFSLRDGTFPLLTTKTVFWRGLVEELLWFIKGCTDSKVLSNKRVKIWDGNGSREFLDKLGFINREEGDLGPIYSHQWRHYGAEYKDCHTDYTGQGIDQLANCIEKIKNNPQDRRIIMSAWNPSDLHKMALPPCHALVQFYVSNGELSCAMFQRSADFCCGIPLNIASYSLLTCMIAQVCGLKPGNFLHFLGDTHVYENHVEGAKEQVLRKPFLFPKLVINPLKMNIDEFVYEDFQLQNYKAYPAIKFKMAI